MTAEHTPYGVLYADPEEYDPRDEDPRWNPQPPRPARTRPAPTARPDQQKTAVAR